jgi:hypothetical protein
VGELLHRYGCHDCEAPLYSGDEAYVVTYPGKHISLDAKVTDTFGSYLLCPSCAAKRMRVL